MKYVVTGVVPQPMHRMGRTYFDHHPSTTTKEHATNYPVGEADHRIEVVCDESTVEVMQGIFSRLFREVERYAYRP